MILVTTHESADFDSAAGVLGGILLHPDAVAAFPGAKSPAVKDYLDEHPDVLPEIRARDVDLDAVRTLILVDTVAPDRIGRFETLVGRPDEVRVICYDHHPGARPPEGSEAVIRATGSVATLMVERIRGRGIHVTPDQATLLALGIYEDTGALTYGGTTPDDLRAAGWLLEQGADLSTVARALARGLSPEQINLYHAILHDARTVRVHGEPIVVATVAMDEFVPEASVVIQQYTQATGAPRVVALLRMQDRIVMIVRSRADDFDAAAVASVFGGGGHATAASAVIRNKTLIEARDHLMEVLHESLVPSVRARDLATPILYRVEADATVEEAVRLLNRYRVNALPVWDGRRIAGALTRQLADMALHHRLGDRPIRDVLTGEVEPISPDSGLESVKQRLLSGTDRFVLVGESPERIDGIITRTALLRDLRDLDEHGPPHRGVRRRRASSAEGEDLSPMLERRLPSAALELLRAVGEIASVEGSAAYLVGGMIRDLLLRRDTRDLDIVVEGDACALARALGERLDARVHVHEAFQTAAVFTGDDLRLDLATARTEHYERPGALPEVVPGGLRQDVFRRDFTINTLAVQLAPRGFGRLLDHFGGRRDLQAGKIRVLHGLSFIEDPTRAYRAIRFALRLGFEISSETAHLMRVALREEVFARLSPDRLRREVQHILGEKRLVRAVHMLEEYQLLSVLHPALRANRTTYTRLERAEEALAWYRLLYRGDEVRAWTVALGVLADKLDEASREELVARLRPGRATDRFLREAPERVHEVIGRLARRRSIRASRVHEVCRAQPPETLLLAMSLTGREEVRRSLSLYLSRLRDVSPDIDGADLLAAGVPEGPAIASALDAALRAKLDGKAPDRETQLRKALAKAGAA
jgi:tRNA nucleotidyltransferase (CCA-adding enzyme)